MSTAGRGRVVDPLNRAVVDVLNGLVSERKLTHPELSELSGIPRSTLSKLLAGASALDLGQLSAICAPLGVPTYKVLKEAEEAASALDTEEATANVDAAGVLRRLSVVDGGHAASARRGRAPSLAEIEQANGNMA